MNILDYFPLPNIRPIQEQAIPEIHAAFTLGKRFVIFEGPPGAGKSQVAATLARYYREAYIVTATKQLQAQYMKDFTDAVELKGRPNFDCVKLEAGSCEAGAAKFVKTPCPPLECPYRVAKAEAVKAELTICNYYSYLWNVGKQPWASAALLTPQQAEQHGGQWKRPLLVLDEAHCVEDVLVEHTAVTVDTSKVPIDMPAAPDTVEACFAWLELFLVDAAQHSAETMTSEDAKEFIRLQNKAKFALDHQDDTWIYEPLEDEKQGFRLKPLTVKTFGEQIFQFGERVLLMSATILDAAKMAESLGIKDCDYAYVKSPCTFPVDNRPIICASLNMTKAHRGWSWPAMVDQIKTIMRHHDEEKGLILTPSNEMLNHIFQELPMNLRQRLILARGADRLEQYQRHLDATEPTVLLASGFWEGADLKDDYSRFQVLPAIPRPYWGGQIAARAKFDPTWYRWKAFCQLVQGVGRSVRSETDSAVTYVLDTALKDEAARADTMLPAWFREAMIYA